MRTKVGLLSRVSTLALIAATGSFGMAGKAVAAGGCAGQVEIDAPTTISTDIPCAFVDNVLEPGDVINNANVGPGNGKTGFFVGNGGIINGALINYDTIEGGTPGSNGGTGTGALTIAGGNVKGGVFNYGQITSEDGHGIALGYAKYYYDYEEQQLLYVSAAHMTGNIVNGGEFAGTINGGVHGVAAFYGTMSGALINNPNGVIIGGDKGVYIADTFEDWSGGIKNWGSIAGDNAGIQVGDSGYTGETSVVFSGGIANYSGATISSLKGPTVVAGGYTFSGGPASHGYGIYNAGVITQRSEQAANGEGTYAGVGILVTAETFNDGIYNTGRIDGLGGPAIWITTETYAFNDGIKNAAGGQIVGEKGVFIESAQFNGDLVNDLHASIIGNGCGCEDAAVFADTNWNGNVQNAGLMQSVNADGFRFEGSAYNGNFTNTGTFDQENTLIGGKIIGAKSGVVFAMPSESTLANGDGAFVFTNSGLIQGTYGNGLDISASDIVAALSNTNTGEIKGGDTGMRVSAGTFDGTITNAGKIIGDSYGAYINAGTFVGDITNTASGYIEGGEFGTGAYISADTFSGNITNNGQIIGGGFDTGLHIVTTGVHTGAIVNNGSISAASNALHVEIGELYQSGELPGTILNTGTIRATGGGEYESTQTTAVLLDVGNGATFTNASGGLILGDVVFDGEAVYTFVGEEGRIEGDLVGYGGEGGDYTDDKIIVRDGEQYFADGTARRFESFTVEEDGIAVMGGQSNGYAFSNVNALNVNTGGMLFIAQPTTLVVDGDYTQQQGSTLAFYLGAPSDISAATGSLTAGSADYGQVIVNGTAFLDGTIAAELDPAFATANSGLDRVVYNDVLIADEIDGTFDDASLLANSAIFQLSYDINPGVETETVDLFVTRTPLGHTSLGGIIVETTASFDNAVSTNSVSLAGGACGIAGPGWCVNRYAANEAGATQVMTDATPGEDPFSWLRAGQRRVGETAAWGRVVGGWGDTDGDAGTAGSKFDNVGAIVGVDHTFTPILLAGLAVQWTATDIDFKGRPDKADVDSLEVGAYASWGDYRLYLNANVSYIWHEFDVRRFIGADRAFGDYDGTTFSTYAEGGKTFETDGGALIQPFISLSYSHLDTDAYAETGTNPNVQLNVQSAEFDSLRGTAGLRVGYPIKMSSGRMMVPEARAGWSHEFLDDQSTFLATLQGGPPAPPVLITGEEYSRDTLVLGGGITVPLADQVVAFADYDAGLNDDVTTHTVSGGVRVKW